MAETVETAIYRLRVEGQEQLDKLKTSLDGITVSEEKVDGATRTTSATLQSRLARMDPLIKAQESYRKELESAARYAEAGIGTEAQRSAQIELATQRYNAHVSAIQAAEKATVKGAAATGLARHELVNLSRQFQDVAVSLGSGQSFGTVLLQQGTQISDVFATSQGSVKGFLGQIVSGAANVLTPMRLIAGGALGIGAAAAYMAVQWDNAQKETERALVGIGQRTGTTLGDINKFTKDNASAAGLSITEARNVAIEFTKTGAITVAGLHGVGEAVHGFATLTGTDATEATKKLASAFSGDLAKGADELNKTYGFLDSATRKQIESLQLQGDRMGAVQVIIDKMAPSNIKAAESVGILTQAWTGFKNVISNIGNLPGQSDQDKLAGLQAQRAAATNTPAVGITPGGFLNTSAAFGGKSAQLADLDKQIDDLQKKLDGLKADGAAAQLRALSVAGDAVVKSIIPQIEQIDNLEKALETLRAAQNTPGVSRSLGADDAAVTAIQNQLQALKESQAESARYNQNVQQIAASWGNVGQAVALQLQTMQNNLPVAQAWTNATKMRAQEEATYLNLLQKGLTSEEASAVAAKEYETSKAAAVASAKQLVQSSEDNLEKIKAQGTGMEGVVASSIAYRDAIQAGATATQAAAISANVLEANLLQAAQAADRLAQSAQDAQTAALQANGGGVYFASDRAAFGGNTITPGKQYASVTDPLGLGNPDLNQAYRLNADLITQIANISYATGGLQGALDAVKAIPNTTGATGELALAGRNGYDVQKLFGPERSTIGDKISTVDALFKSQPGASTSMEIEWLKANMAPSVERDAKIAELTNAIGGLTSSTDSLNRTMGDLLSPYYTQDPRTSHIGFRSQGMASGGEFTVPGGYSANDNMLGTIPLASGEIVSVRRPGESAGTVVNIVNNISVAAGADRATVNAIGRTVYQSTQSAARNLKAAGQ